MSGPVGFLEIFWMLQHVSLEVKPTIKQGFPEFHIQSIEKIVDGEKGAIEKLLARSGPDGNEEPFPNGFPLAEWDLIDPVLLDPE